MIDLSTYLSDDKRFDIFGIIQIKGHQTIAGRITEITIAGHGFLLVTTPDLGKDKPSYSEIISPTSVHAITPCDEDTAKMAAIHNVPLGIKALSRSDYDNYR